MDRVSRHLLKTLTFWKAWHHLATGQVEQAGFFGVQTVAPSSIKDWLKSPGRVGSTVALAKSLSRCWMNTGGLWFEWLSSRCYVHQPLTRHDRGQVGKWCLLQCISFCWTHDWRYHPPILSPMNKQQTMDMEPQQKYSKCSRNGHSLHPELWRQ